jgi:asparagine synthase (glutamine-hydrolysing)
MARSLEVRGPCVDTVLIRHVLRLSGRWKTRGWLPKPLLLDALRGNIPEYVSHRPKMGFVLPFDRWMRSRFRPQIEETFGNRELAESIGLRPEAVQEVWQGFLKRSVRWSHPWSLFVLMRWCERHGVSL